MPERLTGAQKGCLFSLPAHADWRNEHPSAAACAGADGHLLTRKGAPSPHRVTRPNSYT